VSWPSSAPLAVELRPGIEASGATLHDRTRDLVVQLSAGEQALAREFLARGRLQGAHSIVDPASLAGLADAGVLSARLSLGLAVRALLEAFRHGDDAGLHNLRLLATRRHLVSGCRPWTVWARTLATLLRHWRAVSLPLLALLLALGALAGRAGPVALRPAAVVASLLVSVASHESGHLWMLRRVTGQPDVGALHIGPWLRLGVVRPELAPRPLLLVAAAGPLAGAAATASLLAVNGIIPRAVAVLLTAGQLVGLTPMSHDGRDLVAALRGRPG